MKKILTGALIISPLLLTSCWNRDMAPQEPADTSRAATMTQEEAKTLLADADFSVHNASLQDLAGHLRSGSGSQNMHEYIASLSGSDQDTIVKRAYVQSFVGDYTNANKTRDELCSYNSAFCEQADIDIKIPKIVDKKGTAIENARVYVDTKKINTPSDARLYNDMVHRIRVEKEGYLDTYGSLNALQWGYNVLEVAPVMKAAEAHTSAPALEAVTQKVTHFEYNVPANAFVDQSWQAVTGNVDVYYYSMNQDDQDLSIFDLSAFGANGELVGDNMITYGMPLITAYKDGEPLRIVKPIQGTGTILGITPTMDLKNVPKNVWLTGNELLTHGIPPFWSLNRETGVWTESKMMILDEAGNYRFEIIR